MADLLEVIKKAALDAVKASGPATVTFGTVISIDPLQINVEQKLTLTAAQLILSEKVTDYQTWLSFDNPSIKQKVNIYKAAESEPLPGTTGPGEEPHSSNDSPPIEVDKTTDIQFAKKQFSDGLHPAYHDVTIYNGLKSGDKVILMRMQGGQKFIVVDRLGAV